MEETVMRSSREYSLFRELPAGARQHREAFELASEFPY